MKLYGQKFKTMTHKVLVLLMEKQVDFEYSEIFPRDYSENILNPTLVNDGITVSGSLAICDYLEKNFTKPGMFPEDPNHRGLTKQIEEIFYSELCILVEEISMHLGGEYYSRPDIGKTLLQNRLKPIISYLEKLDNGNSFIVGDKLSIADVSIGVAFRNFSRHSLIYVSDGPHSSLFDHMGKEFPRISRCCEFLWSRKSFQSLREITLSNKVFIPSY